MSKHVNIVAQGTGFIEFEVAGFRACAFSCDGSVCSAAAVIPEHITRIGESLIAPMRRDYLRRKRAARKAA